MRTLQETFDYVVNKIVEQGGQCMQDGHCVYGNNEEKHCAIGWLLDHSNKKLMEYTGSLSGLMSCDFSDLVPDIIKENPAFFDLLQSFHDTLKRTRRHSVCTQMHGLNVDISNPNVQKWIDMGN